MELKERAGALRRDLFRMMARAGQGHPGSVFSMVEIALSIFYSKRFKAGPENSRWDKSKRDKVIVSKGHATMTLYPILADLGHFDRSEIDNYGTRDSLLKIFGNIGIPGIDATSGSLGHGVGIGAGYCVADKSKGVDLRSYVIISEGEMYEGSIWESALFASHQKLDNLVVFLDRNHKIILGDTEDCEALEPIADKWAAFGWDVKAVNGHDFEQLNEAMDWAQSRNGKPKIVIADTVKGKGASIMEHKPEWHYWQGMTSEEVEKTMEELN